MLTGHEPHPVIPLLAPELEETLPQGKVAEYYALRREAMEIEEIDPYNYGFEPPVWATSDKAIETIRTELTTGGVPQALVLGGNRASKTHYAAKRVVQTMVNKPKARVWCLQSNQAASRADQQSLVFKQLPAEWRPESGKLRQGKDTKINYSSAGGFTEDTFVLPNGSQCWFKFYGAQVGSLEGAELDMAWADELVPQDWVEALRFRLITRNGLLLITFTPIEGYSSTAKEFLDGAITTEEVEAELLPIRNAEQKVTGYEKVPRVQRCQARTATVIYFHTKDNPYGNYESMKVELSGSPKERILTRAYGVPTKATMTQFPLFRDAVHIVSVNFFEQIVKAGGTRYHLIDPCPGNRMSGRNWFMVWVFIDSLGRKFYYREWPSHGHNAAYIPGVGDPGPWAVPGKAADGEKGPAQASYGWSLGRYRDEILRLEKLKFGKEREPIFERWMDSRYGNAPTNTKEESTTLIEQMRNELEMDFLAAPGGTIGEGVELINNGLYYDTTAPVSPTNQPHMYVVETCPNLIYALKEWTGRDGQHGSCKDPIDLCRYAEMAELGYCNDAMLAPRTPWREAHRK